jgi:hypothetical protein
MDSAESKREIYLMIEQIPDDSLDEAKHLLRELLERREKHESDRQMTDEEFQTYLDDAPYDDEELSEEDHVRLGKADEDIKAGRLVPWEQVERELESSLHE